MTNAHLARREKMTNVPSSGAGKNAGSCHLRLRWENVRPYGTKFISWCKRFVYIETSFI